MEASTNAVSDSSPLIALSSIGCLDLLPQLFYTVHISAQVYAEVVTSGAGRPGVELVAQASWIKVTSVQSMADLERRIGETGLGSGEVSAVQLARELGVAVVLIDERRARRYAEEKGLTALGCIGILEALHRKGALLDLRSAYARLREQKFRIEPTTLERSLRDLKLPPLWRFPPLGKITARGELCYACPAQVLPIRNATEHHARQRNP
jgi:predicted nucleic acid-binding protein